MGGSGRKFFWGSLAAGLLAIAGIWLVLEARSRESERLLADRSRRREEPLPRPLSGTAPPTAKVVRAPSPEGAAPTTWPEIEAPAPGVGAAPSPPPRLDASDQSTVLDANVPFLRRPERAEVPGLQAKAQDLSTDPKERLAVLARLRVARPDGRSPEVVRSMIDLLRTSSDPSIRAEVCRQLKGVQSEDLKQQLLVSVRTDNDPRTREEAVESLGPMKGDPAVRQVLQTSLATDPDERVRNEAKRSLTGGR